MRYSSSFCLFLHVSVRVLLFSPLIGWDSRAEALEGQSVELGAGSEGTQEVVAEGGASLQKSDSVEQGEEEEEPEPSK